MQRNPGGFICDAAYSCDGQSIYACFLNKHIIFVDSASFSINFVINPIAYLLSNQRKCYVYLQCISKIWTYKQYHPLDGKLPSILYLQPTKHNQFALELSDGGVLVKEFDAEDIRNGYVACLSLRPATYENLIWAFVIIRARCLLKSKCFSTYIGLVQSFKDVYLLDHVNSLIFNSNIYIYIYM